MTLPFVWKVVLLILVCPLIGGLPLIAGITRLLAGKKLSQLGTGNISVSAAFYHGGQWVGILAVLSEALKGIGVVLLARYFFPNQPSWEIVALIALVIGRYLFSRGAGTTNVVWGYIIHDAIAAGLIALIGGVSFTLLRERQWGKLGVLVLLPLITALRHPNNANLVAATLILSLLLGLIYRLIPDDLALSSDAVHRESSTMFRFFRGDRAVLSLQQSLQANQVGQKAATLSQLYRWGYPVPMGWVVPPGDDPAPLVESLHPDRDHPLVVRSSAIGEDSPTASAAGQYLSLLNITSQPALAEAILRCQASYNLPNAVKYRLDLQVPEEGMAVLVQVQVKGVFSGVAFSRDPISRQGEAVVIEALPGNASRIVSGQFTPESYRVLVPDAALQSEAIATTPAQWQLPEELKLAVNGEGDIPPALLQQVAYLARSLELRFQGTPQDIEWSYDGQQLWILQSRPITTLLPIWTRKIAAEVIPGWIHPLTWSINRPLTCGVWGEIFTIVLGDRARGLDFNETATLHNSAAYFNASLLGEIFLRMGLPPESLEFLTRGAKFSKPPLSSTLRNIPGLLRLVGRELQLETDFKRDFAAHFAPALNQFQQQSPDSLDATSLLSRIYQILDLLKRATYYSILAPLSLAVRQGIFRVQVTDLDNRQTPEVASVRSLQELARQARSLLPNLNQLSSESSSVFAALAETPDGASVLKQFDEFLAQYGYLSEVATDIAVPTWREDPRPVRELFAQFVVHPPATVITPPDSPKKSSSQPVQSRLNLKGQVTEVYSCLLAELRWSFIALAHRWQEAGWLAEPGDLFFLKFDEIEALVKDAENPLYQRLEELIAVRRSQLERDRQITPVPSLVYGNQPPRAGSDYLLQTSSMPAVQLLQGIGASPGRVEGQILVLTSLQSIPSITADTILVVPYTDSGWAPLLARASGLIAEVGGRLSHGAILAREYGIPAVMDIQNATQLLKTGQRVRLDGATGTVEKL